MTATSATFPRLAGRLEPLIKAGQEGMWRAATRAAMYNAFRTAGRPPQIRRRPRNWPLSQLNGATPTKAAIARRSSVPNSGNSASSVRAVIRPMLGTLRRRSSWARQIARL